MKEHEFKKILTTPVTDKSMDENIIRSLLNYPAGDTVKSRRCTRNFPKIAAAVFILAAIGTGTALASSYIKTYFNEIHIKSVQEVDITEFYGNGTVKKRFGAGNRMISLMRDVDGNIPMIDDEGYYVFKDGSRFAAPYLPDPDRHENARKSGDEAFAEIGYPNLVPAYIYENYLLDENGFIYYEKEMNDSVYKWIMAGFVTDAYETGDFLKEQIWVTFVPRKSGEKGVGSIYITNSGEKEDYIRTDYITENGVRCSIVEIIGGNITANIFIESETAGNGELMVEFKGFEMDKVKEILDTISF